MEQQNSNDPLGILALTEEIRQLRTELEGLIGKSDPYADLIPEAEFSERIKMSRSSLRNLRTNGTIVDSWVKSGNHVFWSPRIFREELIGEDMRKMRERWKHLRT